MSFMQLCTTITSHQRSTCSHHHEVSAPTLNPFFSHTQLHPKWNVDNISKDAKSRTIINTSDDKPKPQNVGGKKCVIIRVISDVEVEFV